MLDGEKIDFVEDADDPILLIKNCLKPAQINTVELLDSRAIVTMDESQKALAIGK